MLIEQLINLRKVISENLKFRTDLRDQVMVVGQYHSSLR